MVLENDYHSFVQVTFRFFRELARSPLDQDRKLVLQTCILGTLAGLYVDRYTSVHPGSSCPIFTLFYSKA